MCVCMCIGLTFLIVTLIYWRDHVIVIYPNGRDHKKQNALILSVNVRCIQLKNLRLSIGFYNLMLERERIALSHLYER